EHVVARSPSTASCAFGLSNEAVAPAGLAASAATSGACGTTGAGVSVTRTVNEPFDEFPLVSVAVQLTVVSPTAKLESEAGAHGTVGAGSSSSVAVTVYGTGVAGPVASAVTVPGSESAGPVVSAANAPEARAAA